MLIVFIIQVIVCVLILRWLLKKKTGQPYSKKAIIKFLGAGAAALIVCLVISMISPISKDSFFHLNPILAGFLTALITAALFEELVKYVFFRLALIRNEEVISWLDVIIACVIAGMGFVLMEDAEFAVAGSSNILRAVIPAHLLFQGTMGYYYGKARVTKNRLYDVLSLAVPILIHTLFDMFLISLMAIIGDGKAFIGATEQELMALPYWNYVVPLLVCAIAVFIIVFVALILMFRKIGIWSENGEKGELLKQQN